MRAFHAEKKRIPKTEDSLAERDEFEPSVPLVETKRPTINVSSQDKLDGLRI